MESSPYSELSKPAAFILASEALISTPSLETCIKYAPITRNEIDEFAQLSPNSGDPESILKRADQFWDGLISLNRQTNKYSVIAPPRFGVILDKLKSYSQGMQFYGYGPRIDFGPKWNKDLVEYCGAFATYKKEQMEVSYILSKRN